MLSRALLLHWRSCAHTPQVGHHFGLWPQHRWCHAELSILQCMFTCLSSSLHRTYAQIELTDLGDESCAALSDVDVCVVRQ